MGKTRKIQSLGLIVIIIMMIVLFYLKASYLLSAIMLIITGFLFFAMCFEYKRIPMRELVIIAVFIVLAVASRAMFYMTPQIKPICAIVILGGIVTGASGGFLIGTVSVFLSNFMYVQGIHTPFQMLAMGLIGFFAGVVLNKHSKPMAVSIYGFLAVLLIYGAIVDLSVILMLGDVITIEAVLLVIAQSLPFNLINGVSSFAFLILLSKPMQSIFERLSRKYGVFAD